MSNASKGRQAKFLFEVSWEACNKVGGIYTVLRSKADLINNRYQNYFLIGPYFEKEARTEFSEDTLPHGFKEVFDELKQEGIVCYFGKWQIKGAPNIILIDFSKYWPNKNKIKTELWNNYKIDSLNSGQDFDEPVVWATSAGRLIEKFIQKKEERGEKIECIAQFHEWLAGPALLYLKKSKARLATVFTTHATVLGRTISASGRDLYGELKDINPDSEANRYGNQAKHLMEKSSANAADIFTTVSEITALEAEKLLGRKPEVLLLNGLDMEKLPTTEDAAYMHRTNRAKIHEFLRYYFLPYYYFDIENTVILFIVGRYEFKNKGIDLVIDALAGLNEMLKNESLKTGEIQKTVVCFFWIPRDVHGVRAEISTNKSAYLTLKDFVAEQLPSIKTHIVTNIIKSGTKDIKRDELNGNLFDDDFVKNIKKLELNFSKQGNPPLSTHNIPGEDYDAIIRALREKGLDNHETDRVKVIFYPIYLTGVDGLTDLSYYNAMNACHLGLFPSYYEPWGYTPLECGALAVPSLTTDLGGFGRFLLNKTTGTSGIYVLKRHGREMKDVIKDFVDILYNFSKLNLKERVQQKMLAKELANLADWNVFIQNYFDAHEMAFKRAYGEKG
jgi:glycogen(starch) synthase